MSSVVIQCLLSREEASRLEGDEPFSCPLMTFLHKLQGHRMFSILFPSNKRKINSPEESLMRREGAWGGFRFGRVFVVVV